MFPPVTHGHICIALIGQYDQQKRAWVAMAAYLMPDDPVSVI